MYCTNAKKKSRSLSSTTKQKKPAKRRGKRIIKPGTYECKPTHRHYRTLQNRRKIVSPPLPPPPKSPKLNSFLLPPAESATELERIAMDWILKDLLNIIYKDSIVPIIPYCNSIRMCHQSPQAMRLFFSAPVTKKELSDEVVSQTTGQFPTIPQKKKCQQPVTHGYISFFNAFEKAMRNCQTDKTWGNGSKQIQSIRKERVGKNPAGKKTKISKKTKAENFEELHSYGLLAVLNTTGFHPTQNIKVRPFCEKLQKIARLLTEEVQNHLKPNPEHCTDQLDFNHMEVKLYHGKDIYQDEDGCPLRNNEGKEIRDDCNKIVNFHNDISFNDQGEQSSNDTVKGDHPIATLTIGATRNLTFKHKWKMDSTWSDGETVDFELNQGSIFCLLPNDEKPKKIENRLHKTQHMAKFSKDGISIALVFRSVKKKSIFHKKTHRWRWKEDSYYKEKVRTYLRKKKGRYKDIKYREGTVPEEVMGMMKNATKFLRGMTEGNRFLEANTKRNDDYSFTVKKVDTG